MILLFIILLGFNILFVAKILHLQNEIVLLLIFFKINLKI